MTSLRPGEIIRQHKDNREPDRRFVLPIRDEAGEGLGTLICVDRALARDPAVIADITAWRRRFKRYFRTQFEPTCERTASWFEKVVFPHDDRLLFLISLPSGEVVGNIGVCEVAGARGSIDNLIRGRKGGHPKLVLYAEIAVLAWMFGPLGLREANGHVLSDNARSMKFHLDLGFTVCASRPMSRVVTADEVRLLVDSEEGEPIAIRYEEMYMARETFLARHPWTADVYPGL